MALVGKTTSAHIRTTIFSLLSIEDAQDFGAVLERGR